MSISLLLSQFHYVLESAEALRLVEPSGAVVVAVHSQLHALRSSPIGLDSDPSNLRLPDMVRWPQLPESKSSRFSGFFWVNMRLSRFIATFSADKGHDT